MDGARADLFAGIQGVQSRVACRLVGAGQNGGNRCGFRINRRGNPAGKGITADIGCRCGKCDALILITGGAGGDRAADTIGNGVFRHLRKDDIDRSV